MLSEVYLITKLKKMKIKFLIIILLFNVAKANSQIITLLDIHSRQPLENATLSDKDNHKFTTTNSKGQTDVSIFKATERIEVRMLGYETLQLSYNDFTEKDGVIYLKPKSFTFDEIVISGTKWGQLSRDIPVKIASISSRDVTLFNPQTAADLLSSSGKVFIQKSQQGGGSPMIRGFATNRLLYSIDGVRMNTAIFRGGNIQNVISLDPYATEKTEVLFGPGSVIYGSDAIGGVMSFQTLRPQLSLNTDPLVTGKASMRYSSANNENTGHFDVNVGWRKWALLTSFSANKYGDLKMGSHGPDEYLRPFYVVRQDSVDVIQTNADPRIQTPSGYQQINLMQKVYYKPSKNVAMTYALHFSETSSYSRYDRHIRYKKGLPRYGEWNYGPQKWMMNQFNIELNNQNAFYDAAVLRLAAQQFGESRIDRDINKTTRHIREEKVDAYSINIDLKKSLSRKNNLFYGVELVWNNVKSAGIDENIATGERADGPSRYPQALWSSYAAYMNNHHKFNEKLTLEAGLRYNYYLMDCEFSTEFFPFPFTNAGISNGSPTGSIGLVYHPFQQSVFSTNFSTGFRAPNVDDIGKVFDSEQGSVTVPNPDLKSEYVYNFEISYAQIIAEAVKLDFTGYYTYLDNALVRRDFTLNGEDSIMYDGTLSKVQAMQNAAKAIVIGIQAGIEIRLGAGFVLSSDINLQKGEEELDDATTSPSRHAAPWFGNTKMIFRAEKLEMNLYALYSGKKTFEQLPLEEQGKPEIYAIDENGNPWSPGWYTLNYKASYALNNNFSINAGVENITDQRYRPYSSGIVAPGRNFILSFTAKF